MITDVLLTILYYAVYAFTSPLRLLNDVTLTSDFQNAVDTAGGYLASVNFVIPVTTILSVFGLFLAIEGAIFFYKAIMWGIRKIPLIN